MGMSSAEQSAFGEADSDKATAADDEKPRFHIVHSEAGGPAGGLALWLAQDIGYDTVTTSITTVYFHSRVLKLLNSYVSSLNEPPPRGGDLPIPTISPILSKDTNLSPTRDASQLVGYISPWIDLFSPDPIIADISRQVFMMEITYAAFCGVRNIIVTGPGIYDTDHANPENITQYARDVQEVLLSVPSVQLAIHIPMLYQTQTEKEPSGYLALFAREVYTKPKAEEIDHDLYESWDSWNIIRTVCQHSPRLSIALLIPRHLPSESLQSRWFAEPLGFLSFTATRFLPNSKSQLHLSKGHQSLIFRYTRQQRPPWLLIYDVETPVCYKESASTDKKSSSPPEDEMHNLERTQTNLQRVAMHLRYFRLLQRHQPPKAIMEQFGSQYEDDISPPMQSSSDHLDSPLYEGVEKDSVKYEWYERAITHALKDWDEKQKPTSAPDKRVVIAVAGPGRVPLVTRVLQASAITKVPIDIWAIEKNPHTYAILERHNKNDWGGVVNIVHSDIRAWKGPPQSSSDATDVTNGKVDILVSELLGSFADNKLSPECIDGIQHVLATPHGISIPSSYSAHLTPILAPRIYGQISRAALTNPTAYDTAYCVSLHTIDYLAISVPGHPYIQQAWEYMHPLPSLTFSTPEAGANKHNKRHSRLRFTCKNRGVVNGIAGYLEAVLYDGGTDKLMELSTRPDNIDKKSQNMLSWFPMFFPLKTPLYFPDDTELEVSIWRETDGRKVWYEWLVEAFAITASTKRTRLATSEVGSTRQKGCLM